MFVRDQITALKCHKHIPSSGGAGIALGFQVKKGILKSAIPDPNFLNPSKLNSDSWGKHLPVYKQEEETL